MKWGPFFPLISPHFTHSFYYVPFMRVFLSILWNKSLEKTNFPFQKTSIDQWNESMNGKERKFNQFFQNMGIRWREWNTCGNGKINIQYHLKLGLQRIWKNVLRITKNAWVHKKNIVFSCHKRFLKFISNFLLKKP